MGRAVLEDPGCEKQPIREAPCAASQMFEW